MEVFNFYCRKFAAVSGDFNAKSQNLVVLGLQGYTRFAKDFKVPLGSSELTTVWKKSSSGHQPHEFDQFQKSITLLGVTVNKVKVEKLRSRQKQLKRERKRRLNQADPATVSTGKKGPIEKMTDGEISGELTML